MTDVVMPRLSDAMEEGTVLKWLKAPGEAVARGEALVEIETDKATMTHVADTDGVLEIVAAEGDTVAIGAVIARIGTDARDGGQDPARPAAAGDPAPPGPAAAPAGTAKGEVTVVELSRAQQVAARRTAEAKATVPELVLGADVDMEACVELGRRISALGGEIVPTCDDMVVKACALALREHPRANAAHRDGRFELYSRVNVGIAVPAQGAVVVPTIFDADRRSLADLAATARVLAERADAGELTPPELGGGTFTVSSLGAYGVTRFTAVINPPQAGALAVGALERRAVVRDGEIAARHVLSVTLTCDHRILYGAEAGAFLARIRDLLERPAALLPLGLEL